jgi:hypothetical protein
MTHPTARRLRLTALACASVALLAPAVATASDTVPGLGALELLGGDDWQDGVVDPDAIAAETEEELAGLGLGDDFQEEYAGIPSTPPGTDGGPMLILYDTQESVWDMVYPRASAGPGLTAARGAFRQDPGPGGLFSEDGNDSDHRIGKVSAEELVGLSAQAMADRLKAEIDAAEHGATSHLVAIDEIGNKFNDGRVRIKYRNLSVRGKKIRVAAHNKLVITPTGYRIQKGKAPVPAVQPTSNGARLAEAMRLLDVPSPYGGTYAERVHLYLAPAFGSSIGTGLGEHRHLGRDGKPHKATWRGVMPALALAGGVWIEMYHYSHSTGTYSMSAREWKLVPARFGSYFRTFGGNVDRLHIVFTGARKRPAGAPRSCGEPMACQWKLARSTKAGRAMLANGPGAYRVGSSATAWLRELNADGIV